MELGHDAPLWGLLTIIDDWLQPPYLLQHLVNGCPFCLHNLCDILNSAGCQQVLTDSIPPSLIRIGRLLVVAWGCWCLFPRILAGVSPDSWAGKEHGPGSGHERQQQRSIPALSRSYQERWRPLAMSAPVTCGSSWHTAALEVPGGVTVCYHWIPTRTAVVLLVHSGVCSPRKQVLCNMGNPTGWQRGDPVVYCLRRTGCHRPHQGSHCTIPFFATSWMWASLWLPCTGISPGQVHQHHLTWWQPHLVQSAWQISEPQGCRDSWACHSCTQQHSSCRRTAALHLWTQPHCWCSVPWSGASSSQPLSIDHSLVVTAAHGKVLLRGCLLPGAWPLSAPQPCQTACTLCVLGPQEQILDQEHTLVCPLQAAVDQSHQPRSLRSPRRFLQAFQRLVVVSCRPSPWFSGPTWTFCR